MSEQQHKIALDGVHVPNALRERQFWVLWDVDEKTALAPWDTGHMYRTKWSKKSEMDPRTDYQTAEAVASLPPERIAESYPFPDTTPDDVKPTPLLQQATDRTEPFVTFVDYDDVVVDGAVSGEVWQWVERFGGPTFVSSSGTGLHQWVYGELPDGLGKLDVELDGVGSIEIYDHARMTGSTWRHVSGTPHDELEPAGEVIADVVREYGGDSHLRRMGKARNETPTTQNAERDENPKNRDTPTNEDRSDYYELDVHALAQDEGDFAAHEKNTRGNQYEGPHPDHGPKKSAVHECTNFGVETSDNVWKCWAHDDGGGGLELIAIYDVDGIDCGTTNRLHNRPEKLLEACLYARDEYSAGLAALDDLTDSKPPYKALAAVAEMFDLPIENEATGRLGENTYSVARRIFDDLSPEDI
jgi:hypothetical protein